MKYKKGTLFLWILILIILIIYYHYRIDNVKNEIQIQIKIQNQIRHELFMLEDKNKVSIVLPILIFACNRNTITRTLDQLLKFRPSKTQFPIYVSLGCLESDIEKSLHFYQDEITILIHTPLSYDYNSKISFSLWGYYKISRHYNWSLTQMFGVKKFEAVIIVEDDFDISPDFFEYFHATYSLLQMDPTIWCISCWNDNGLANLTINDPALLHRSDFFPGLGWLLSEKIWHELRSKWPDAFWDDWMRRPDVRLGRVCIRPEISRVYTFGVDGVSRGQYFEEHLSKIMLNIRFVHFKQMTNSLMGLLKKNYDPKFLNDVYNESETITLASLLRKHPLELGREPLNQRLKDNRLIKPSYKIIYHNQLHFEKLTKTLGLMSDYRGGVSRTSYLGIVSFVHRGHKLHLIPMMQSILYE
ncbi:alpha-1,3-mannosyl-glycoprotein 2-beta-N-acetylglucosaminyltransferase-like isoform X2 [Gordionus sp. m RMFG-2023]|uniref:alpha-1,3-mannosyl-glycoprotein 2-beta-N-acetylglucosaminyltransferase-like isoform X2 n=1 Tax=Gordionus sp. m RMFG-2023 TaxID=3053472 RepID=UPI0031FBE914